MEKTNAKIRIRLESFNHELLTSSCQKIVTALQPTSSHPLGVVSLPTQKRIYCVLRSPHVDKDSREHFEIRVHKRILDINCDPETNILDLLKDVEVPSGVFYRIFLG